MAAIVAELEVPIIDLSPFYSDETEARNKLGTAIDKVCLDIGFLVVTAHPDREIRAADALGGMIGIACVDLRHGRYGVAI